MRHYYRLTHEGAAQAREAPAAARTLVTWAAGHSKITDQIHQDNAGHLAGADHFQ